MRCIWSYMNGQADLMYASIMSGAERLQCHPLGSWDSPGVPLHGWCERWRSANACRSYAVQPQADNIQDLSAHVKTLWFWERDLAAWSCVGVRTQTMVTGQHRSSFLKHMGAPGGGITTPSVHLPIRSAARVCRLPHMLTRRTGLEAWHLGPGATRIPLLCAIKRCCCQDAIDPHARCGAYCRILLPSIACHSNILARYCGQTP